MKDILSQLHKSFLSIGLEDAARQVRVAQSLYKDDFKTEVRIFNAIANILEDLKELKPHQIYKKNAYLPGYAIETSTERIVKDEEPLEGYTKKEIISGINNYLQSFIKNYMDVKFDRVSYENEDKYGQAINTISESLREVQQATRSVAKGSVQKLVNKVQRTLQDIDLFTRILKREIPKIEGLKTKDKERWTAPISKSLPSSTLMGGELKGSTWAEALSNVEFDREAEMRAIEADYIESHDIDPEDFYHMIKSFRSHIVEASLDGFVRFAADDETDIDLSDSDTPPAAAKPIPKVDPALKTPEPERKRPSIFDSNKNWLADEPANLRTVVTQVITNGTLFTKDKSGKLQVFSPVYIYRAYYQFLLPQFRIQYTSLLNVAHQNHTSMYQVQAVQNKLAKSLRLAAKALGG